MQTLKNAIYPRPLNPNKPGPPKPLMLWRRVTSVGIQMEGSCDMAKLNEWLSKLLQVRSMERTWAHPLKP